MSDKDKLEQFIVENRTSFDTKEVPEGIWNRIEDDMTQSRQKTIPVLWYWKAAVVVLLAAVTFLVADNYLPTEAEPLSEVTEFQELETFYTSIINKKETKLQEALEGEDAINFLESDIEELEILYYDLRKVYLEEQSTPEVYSRLMHLLRQRIHLINAQLDIIAKSKVPTAQEVILN